FGLNITALRNLYLQDFHNLSNPDSWRALFQKSILSVVDTDVQFEGSQVRVNVRFKFSIYRLPAAKNAGRAILLEKSSAWLQDNEPSLRALPILNPLVRFSAATAIMRTVIENGISNNFDVLLAVPTGEIPTPRLLCRPDGGAQCGIRTLQ